MNINKIRNIEEIKILFEDIKNDIYEIRLQYKILEVKIESLINQLIIWVFGIAFAMAGLIIGVLKLT